MKNSTKKSLKASNGITLIALVITIIVLLILAGISISMLSGDNGILQKATDAKERTGIAEVVENAKLDVLAQISENKGENISKVQLKSILNTYFDDIDNLELPDDLSNSNIKLNANQTYGGYKNIALSDIFTGKFGTIVEVSDLDKLKNFFGNNFELIFTDDGNSYKNNVEPIVDANSSIKEIIRTNQDGYGAYISYNNNYYRILCSFADSPIPTSVYIKQISIEELISDWFDAPNANDHYIIQEKGRNLEEGYMDISIYDKNYRIFVNTNTGEIIEIQEI